MRNNNENNVKKVEELRKEIDKIDDNIIDLLNKRGNLVIQIGNIKKALNLDIVQPAREQEILNKIKSKPGTFQQASMEAIWKEIISASRVIQGTISKIGYLGPLGTFTHQAALDFFPKAGNEFIAYNNCFEIFDDIDKDILEFGVVPIENSLQGTVRETLDLLIEKELIVYGEIELRIIQNIISLKDAELSDIKNIVSHPQAFAQTRVWLKSNLPNVNLIDASSTAEAVRKVKELNDKSYAAIGTEFACKMYDLKVLNSKIEDEPSNFTRFLVISKKENPLKTENMKTSVVFVTKHVPGALYWVLKVFSDAQINLLKIESRPRRKGRWEYIFLMDFQGDKDEPKARQAIETMKSNVIWHKILGCYPMK
ncbi:MAG: prephenate dehydratase [Candidatus Thorarchaeota archaeon]